MGEWEEKLGAILGNPEAMGQIMALARSLDGPTPEPPSEPAPAAPASGPELSALLGGIDPGLLSALGRVMADGGDDRRTALLEALRPFVREQRYAKLDKAIRIARLTRMIRIALDAWKGGGDKDV